VHDGRDPPGVLVQREAARVAGAHA
jgi:hypothetical protein